VKQETEWDEDQKYDLTQALANPLFQQIQHCMHISLSILLATVSSPALSVLRAEVLGSPEDQGGSALPHCFSFLSSSKVWSISRATAWPSTTWSSWGQQKAQECGLGVKDAPQFSSQTLPPPPTVKLHLCLCSQKCADSFKWNFPTEGKKSLEKTSATSKLSQVGKVWQTQDTENKDSITRKGSNRSLYLSLLLCRLRSAFQHLCSQPVIQRHQDKKERDEGKGVLADTIRICDSKQSSNCSLACLDRDEICYC